MRRRGHARGHGSRPGRRLSAPPGVSTGGLRRAWRGVLTDAIHLVGKGRGFLDTWLQPRYIVSVMDVPGRLGPRADLRVGDTDRQRVVAELQRHFVDGRLTSDELGERVDQALRSKTFGELALLTADLPSLAIQPSSPDLLQSESAHLGFGIPIGAMLLLIGLMSMLWMFAVPGGHHPGGFFGFWPIFIWGFFLIGRPARRDRRDHSQGGDPPTRYQ